MNTSPSAQSAHGLTVVAEDYLKAIWSATEWGEPPATVSSLSERFGSTRATASATVRRLARRGLLGHERYGSITLTPEGERIAVAMVRRHRLIETYLAQQLGYGWDEVHDEAERLEHAASDQFVERIDALMGHPSTDPHGDPIPSPDGLVHYPDGATHLSDAASGRYVVVRVSDADTEELGRLAGVGISPQATVTLREAVDGSDERVVEVGGTSHVLGPPAQEGVIVAPAPDRGRAAPRSAGRRGRS